jgi:hypothetical protein
LEAAKIETTINMSTQVKVDARTPIIVAEDKAKALNTLLGTGAFSSDSIAKNLKETPEIDAEEQDKIKKLIDSMPIDEKPSKSEEENIPSVRNPNRRGKKRASRRKGKNRGQDQETEKNDNLGKKLGLGIKTGPSLTTNSRFTRQITKRQAKNLGLMINIVGQKFSWASRKGRK